MRTPSLPHGSLRAPTTLRAMLLTTLLLGACNQDLPCKSGTLFLTIHLDGRSAGADTLDVLITVGTGGAAVDTKLPHAAGSSSGTVEVDFPSGYAAGSKATVVVTALAGGVALGSGRADLSLATGCSATTLTVGGPASGDLGSDGNAVSDGGPLDQSGSDGADGASADLSVIAGPDLADLDLRAVDSAARDAAVAPDLLIPITCAGDVPQCPPCYVIVPGNPAFNTTDFCVSRFEMRIRGVDDGMTAAQPGFVPEARPMGTPWSGLSRDGAALRCSMLGSGFSLMSTGQWQTLARNIEGTAANWSGGSVGAGNVNRGHSDANPAAPLSINNLADACDQTGNAGCTSAQSPDWSQKRTHKLSTGVEVWDVAGNLAEWLLDGTPMGAPYYTGFAGASPNPLQAFAGPSGNYMVMEKTELSSTYPSYGIVQSGGFATVNGQNFSSGTIWVRSGGMLLIRGSNFSGSVYLEPNSGFMNTGSNILDPGMHARSVRSVVDGNLPNTTMQDLDLSQCGGTCPAGNQVFNTDTSRGLGYQISYASTPYLVRGGHYGQGQMAGIYSMTAYGSSPQFSGFRCVSGGTLPCSNGVRDGSETDVDCGGAACARCALTKKCAAATDCISGACTGGTCVLPWTAMPGLINGSVNAIYGTSKTDVFAVGSNGGILHSDNGTSFTVQASGTTKALWGVWDDGAGSAFAVGDGGVILRSINGGAAWLDASYATTDQLFAVWGTSAKNVYVVKRGTGGMPGLLHSTDGGLSWTLQAVGPGNALLSMWGSSAQDLYVGAGNGNLFHSTDAGLSWAHTTGLGGAIFGVGGTGPTSVYAVGVGATIVHSSDGGLTFPAQTVPTTIDLTGVWAGSATDVYAVGSGRYGSGSVILHSDGTTWKEQPIPASGPITCVWGSGPSDVYAGTAGGLLHHP